MDRFIRNWQNTQPQSRVSYDCGYCGTHTSPSIGWTTDHQQGHSLGYVLICTKCNRPTFLRVSKEDHYKVLDSTPSALLGNHVNGLTDEISKLYDEARRCSSIGAHTAVVLSCRKILMHVAVSKGADENISFIKYVDWLSENHYIPPGGKGWVDHIRSKSNEANHEIVQMTLDDSTDLISFTEMLLRMVYEFPTRLPKLQPEGG